MSTAGGLGLAPSVNIIVLNWNGWNDTCTCLSSLQQLSYSNYRVIVVDNGSTDDSAARIRQQFPDVEVVATGKNLGFAAGCNVGIARSLVERADYAWLLNNDTTVDSGALRGLVDKAMSDSQIGAVGSAIYSMDDRNQLEAWGGGRINFWLGRSRHLVEPASDDKVQFITGASLLLPRQAIESIGLLDEGFFMYWEDADYCFRLRRAGWKLSVAGQSKIWHRGSASVGKASAKMDAYFNASAARFFERHSRASAIPLWTGVSLRLAKRVAAEDWERVRAVWKGAIHRNRDHNPLTESSEPSLGFVGQPPEYKSAPRE
jgi:GT2 family glycosyltransferase